MSLEHAINLISKKLSAWANSVVGMLPNLLLACLVLALGLLVAKCVRRMLARFLHRVLHHASLANLLTSFIHLLLVGIVLFAALSILKLDKTVTTLLAGAGVIGLALAFAFQDMAANFVSGTFMAIQRPFKAGHLIKTNDFMGVVQLINLRDTTIKTFQGQVITIPNKEIFQKPLTNFSGAGERRLDIECGVSYDEDLQKVKAVVLETLNALPEKDAVRPVSFYYDKFDASSINFVGMVWLNTVEQAAYLNAKSNAIELIKAAFERHHISIPFPVHTVDLSEKSFKNLAELLPGGPAFSNKS